MEPAYKPNGAPTLHRDGTASWYSVHNQQWLRTRGISDHALASQSAGDRRKLLAHFRAHGGPLEGGNPGTASGSCRDAYTGAFVSCHLQGGMGAFGSPRADHVADAATMARNLKRHISDAKRLVVDGSATHGQLLALYTSIVSANARLNCESLAGNVGVSPYIKVHRESIGMQVALARRLGAL